MNAELAQFNPADLISQELTTTSIKVAEAFGKLHKDILKRIDTVLTQVPESFGKRNFAPAEYIEKNNLGYDVAYRAFELTKDGFMLLVMGFTGEKAMAIKLAYIEAFNWMADQLKTKPVAAALEYQPLTPVSQRRVQKAIAQRVAECQAGRLGYGRLHSALKDAFAVGKYDQLPEGRIEEVVKFIETYSLEGELLPPTATAPAAAPVSAALPSGYQGRVTLMFDGGAVVGAYQEREGSFNTHPDTLAQQLREIHSFNAHHLRQIAEVCLERLSRLARPI